MSETPQDATIEARRLVEPIPNGLLLTVMQGPDAGLSRAFAQPLVTIGRAEACDLRLADPTVSRFQVELSPATGGVRVRDLESVNGTRYEGGLIERGLVPSGAILSLGGTLIQVAVHDQLAPESDLTPAFGELRGKTPSMLSLFVTLRRIARTELSVLIDGPTGSGKELAARAIHEASARSHGPFQVLDCTAIPATLAESVLFGHEPGSFTGAQRRQAGLFESADGGTVFLDEIGELSADLQPKLLRVLSQREVVRVGSSRPLPIDVRVLSATWRDVRTMVNRGRFREDLYYRLAQAHVTIPDLDDRREDIPTLVYHFLQSLPAGAQAAKAIDREALEQLAARSYPGNVRELKNTVERAAYMAEGNTIRAPDLAFERILTEGRERVSAEPIADGDVVPFKDAKRGILDDFEREYLRKLMDRCRENLSQAALRAGVERHYLRKLLRKHGLHDPPE
jgi:DNA-binding NtrC family response regulator